MLVVLFEQEKNKAGDIKTAAEKTATDKKRERRKKKYRKHMKIKEKEKRRKLLEKSNPDQAGKYSKAVASEKLKQLTKTGRASLLKVSRGPGTAGGPGEEQDLGDLPSTGVRTSDTAHLGVQPLLTGWRAASHSGPHSDLGPHNCCCSLSLKLLSPAA